VARSDSGVAHRLSLSARVVSAVDSQVKAKRQWNIGEERPLVSEESALHREQHGLEKRVATDYIPAKYLILSGYYLANPARDEPSLALKVKVYLLFRAH